MIPPIIPLTSNTPRLHQRVSRSPVAAPHKRTFDQGRANPHGAATSRTQLRHPGRLTLEANTSHDTTNHPAHQQHAAFTPACFALPSGTAPRKRTFHQGLANPHGNGGSSRTDALSELLPPSLVMGALRDSIKQQVWKNQVLQI